jgi:hypothetical protein
MRIAVMQPYFFPYIGYFQLINAVDKFIIYNDVNYINKGWINRNNFLINNAPYCLTVPLSKASQNKLIYEVEILDDFKWKNKLKRTIELSYIKAPFFKEVYALLDNLLKQNYSSISEFNVAGIIEVCKYLSINTIIKENSQHYQNSGLSGQHRILDICTKESATHYINPIGGVNLYDKNYFIENKVSISFLQTTSVNYKQFNNEFVPSLSIIDILMFCSKNQIKNELLPKFELK